jgi:hypothetical protein
MKYRSQIASLGVFVGSILALGGGVDHAAPARPLLLNKELASVGNLDWVTSAGLAAVLHPSPRQKEIATVQVAGCQNVDAVAARPKLVLHQPVCASFVFGSDDGRRID